jgi:hypothetical protein
MRPILLHKKWLFAQSASPLVLAMAKVTANRMWRAVKRRTVRDFVVVHNSRGKTKHIPLE